MGFGVGVWGLGVWVWGLGVGGLGVGCGVWGVGCRVWGVGCGVWGVGCGVWGVGLGFDRTLGFGVWGLVFSVRVWRLGEVKVTGRWHEMTQASDWQVVIRNLPTKILTKARGISLLLARLQG